MPKIKSSTDLRNNYNEIIKGRLELYSLLNEGRVAVEEGRKRPIADVMKDLRRQKG